MPSILHSSYHLIPQANVGHELHSLPIRGWIDLGISGWTDIPTALPMIPSIQIFILFFSHVIGERHLSTYCLKVLSLLESSTFEHFCLLEIELYRKTQQDYHIDRIDRYYFNPYT